MFSIPYNHNRLLLQVSKLLRCNSACRESAFNKHVRIIQDNSGGIADLVLVGLAYHAINRPTTWPRISDRDRKIVSSKRIDWEKDGERSATRRDPSDLVAGAETERLTVVRRVHSAIVQDQDVEYCRHFSAPCSCLLVAAEEILKPPIPPQVIEIRKVANCRERVTCFRRFFQPIEGLIDFLEVIMDKRCFVSYGWFVR